MVTVELGCQSYKGRLLLREGTLIVQKEELVYAYSPEHVDPSLLNKERIVRIKREKVGGLGLSIKGGSEHNLPILVSRIFKDQAADKTGQLFVGDSIIKVNERLIENVSHEEAVSALKNGGEEVTLVVKYYRPASFLLSKNRRSSKGDHDVESNTLQPVQNGHSSELEKLWADLVLLPLTCAYVSRYAPNTDHLWPMSFQVTASDGTSSGIIRCEDSSISDEWVNKIQHAISQQTNKVMSEINKLCVPANQVVHMCWISTRTVRVEGGLAKWQREFVAFRGDRVCFFDIPPIRLHDISRISCDNAYKIYDSMFRVLKDAELTDGRQHCCVIESGDGMSRYIGLDSRQELLQLEKIWHRANFQAVKLLGNKTIGCTWRNATCGLTLDLSSGFSLYDNETKCYRWTYKFSQLKRSSDDGTGRLLLEFWNDARTETEIRDLECTTLRTLLFNIHAFLSAKLASVDPAFLINL